LQSLVEQWKKQDEPKERWPLELVELLGSNGVISPIFFSMRTFGAALTAVCLGFSEDRGVVVGAVG
jgi:hypothetical protein